MIRFMVVSTSLRGVVNPPEPLDRDGQIKALQAMCRENRMEEEIAWQIHETRYNRRVPDLAFREHEYVPLKKTLRSQYIETAIRTAYVASPGLP